MSSFTPVTPSIIKEALTTPNIQALLLCHAAWASSHCDPFRQSVLDALPKDYPVPHNLSLLSLDVERHPEAAKQLEVWHLPVLFAIQSGNFVDKLVGTDNPPERIRAFVTNFLQKKVVVLPRGDKLFAQQDGSVEEKASSPEFSDDTCIKWLGVAASLLQKGNIFYAYKMYEKTLIHASTGETQLDCIAGLILCAVIRGSLGACDPHVLHLREMDPSHLSLCVYDISLAAQAPDGVMTEKVSMKTVLAALEKDPKDRLERARLLLLHILGGDVEKALTEVLKLHVIDTKLGEVALKACEAHYGRDHICVLKSRQFLEETAMGKT